MNVKSRNARARMATLCWAFWAALIAAGPAYAAGSGMPWEAPLQQVVDSITGPVARGAGVIAIVVVGLGYAFSEGGGGMRKLVWVGIGLTVAFWAATGVVSLFGFAGGAET